MEIPALLPVFVHLQIWAAKLCCFTKSAAQFTKVGNLEAIEGCPLRLFPTPWLASDSFWSGLGTSESIIASCFGSVESKNASSAPGVYTNLWRLT